MSRKLILIPTPLGDLNTETLPQYVVAQMHQLDTFIAERAKTARHIIKATQPPRAIAELNIIEMQEGTPVVDFSIVKAILESGKNIGIMSTNNTAPAKEHITIVENKSFLICRAPLE